MLRLVTVKDVLKFSVHYRCLMYARRRLSQDVIFDVKRRLRLNTNWMLIAIEYSQVDCIRAEKQEATSSEISRYVFSVLESDTDE